MKNQFAKIVAVLMVLAMAVSVFGLCASAAEETTEANVVLLGDVNLDGKVTIQDATLIQKAIAKLATLDEVQTAAADATEDGEVNIKDATAIQKWIAKVAGANENIGKPLVSTNEEATPDQTPDEATKEEATPDQTPDEATKDEATKDESTKDEPVVDPSTKDEPVVDPSTKDEDDNTDVEPTVNYYIAGSEGLCGVNWVVDGVQMVDDGDGTWSYTFTGIAAGTYEFKVTVGNWDLSYNFEGEAMGLGTNAVFTVEVDDATVIIGFDGEKAVLEFVTAPATKDEPVVDPATKDEEPATKDEEPATKDEATKDEPTATYFVAGQPGLCNGIEWSPNAAENQMTYLGNGVWEITFENVAADTYEFKVTENGTWDVSYNLEGVAIGANASVTVETDGATVVIGFDGTKAYIG
ncbi:MAG: hypothetical protein IJZ54_03525 [Clostridia bacterium]|nr:hypothetical protein [Clostridia bacterium]